ncbi:MAG: pentapeptide repeat-containing protein [bacterium]|nr:pentapeptide repeat-containing protein [bacterium]
MADPLHFDYLLKTLGEPGGRHKWRDYRARNRWIDLSTGDLARRNLSGYDLKDINLSTSVLIEADLAGANLAHANLSFADLRRANLRTADLIGVDLASSNLQEAKLMDVCLEGAQLSGARLAGANLMGADLSRCDLTDANLQGASLKFARLNAARLTGADVAQADLTGAVFDEGAASSLRNFDKAIVNGHRYCDLRSRVARLREEAGSPGPESDREAAAAVGVLAPPTAPPDRGETAPAAPVDGTAPPALVTSPSGRKERERLGWARRRTRKESGAEGPAAAEAGPIPVRDSEPDLETTEGCCEVLDVPAEASMEEIIGAFRQKAKIYHPDKVRHLNERLQRLASDEFQRVRIAYEKLTRHQTRPLVGVNWAEGVPHRASPYDYTIAEYEALARANPANTSILYNLAWKYFDEGRNGEAVAGFQRVLEIDPTDDDANYNLMVVRLYVEISLPALEADR